MASYPSCQASTTFFASNSLFQLCWFVKHPESVVIPSCSVSVRSRCIAVHIDTVRQLPRQGTCSRDFNRSRQDLLALPSTSCGIISMNDALPSAQYLKTKYLKTTPDPHGLAGSLPSPPISSQLYGTRLKLLGTKYDTQTRSEPSSRSRDKSRTHANPLSSNSSSASSSSSNNSTTAFTSIRESWSTTMHARKRALLSIGSSPESAHSTNWLHIIGSV